MQDKSSHCENYVLDYNHLLCGILMVDRCLQTQFLRFDELGLPDHVWNQISVVLDGLRSESIAKLNESKESSKYSKIQANARLREIYLFEVVRYTRRVSMLLDSVIDSCYIITGRLPSRAAITTFFRLYLVWSLLDCLEERFKYHSGYLVCTLLPPSEMPILKFDLYGSRPEVVIGGWVRRFFLSQKVDWDLKLKLALSLQNAKRGAMVISPLKIVTAVQEHRDCLSRQPVAPPLTTKNPSRFTFRQEKQMIEIKSAMRHLNSKYYSRFGNKLFESRPEWRVPSLSACYELGSAFGGSAEQIARSLGEAAEKLTGRKDWVSASKRVHGRKVEYDEYRGKATEMGKISIGGLTMPIFGASPITLGEGIDGLRSRILEIDEKCPNFGNHSRFAAVLEPFKLRALTTGEAVYHQFGRLLQPALHGALKSPKGPFRFIGKRHNVDDIRDVYLGSPLMLEAAWSDLEANEKKKHFTFLVAGDFKSATDNMDPDLPNEFIESLMFLCENLDFFDLIILRKCLQGYYINYKLWLERFFEREENMNFIKRYVPDFEFGPVLIHQKWGQLMGSPLSFPVLCIVNAACFLAAARIYERSPMSWSKCIKKYRPLINGDDISFLSNPEHYCVWKEVCTTAGMVPSPGKNYCSRHIININSTTYRAYLNLNSEGTTEHIWKIEELFVLNSGLIKGQSKVLEDERKDTEDKDEEDKLSPICAQFEEATRVADAGERERCLCTFFDYMGPKMYATCRSWTLPQWAGGLGLDLPRPLTRQEAQQLSYCINNNKFYAEPARKTEVGIWSAELFRQLLQNYKGNPLMEDQPVFMTEPSLSRADSEEVFETPSLENAFAFCQQQPFNLLGEPKFAIWAPKKRVSPELKVKRMYNASRYVKEIDYPKDYRELRYVKPGLNQPVTIIWQ
jgi:hypothetical protein